MAFGILEDHKLESVPGTGLLSDRGNQVTTGDATGLKRGAGRSSHIVLMPQPSDDPNDPLNWPRWRKEACFWTLVFAACLANAISPLASPAYLQLAKDFDVSVDRVSSSFSSDYIGGAIFLLLQNPFAVKYGHRIMYLLSTFLIFISCIWSALSPDLVSISASRVFQGFGGAAVESLVAITIGQLYFIHERGTRSSIWSLSQVSGSVLGSLINSYVIQDLSWRLGFWFVSIACGICFIGIVLFVPELKIYNGTFSEESVWRIFLRQFPLILSPVTWFMILTYVMPSVFLGMVSLCASTIFTVTYGFDTSQIGLTHLSGIIGSAFGMVFAGFLGDRWIVWISQRNRGVYEPEFRLVLILSLLVGVFGYIGWAIGNDHHMPWVGAIACLSMMYFGALVDGSAITPYMIDAHGESPLHIVSLVNFTRNVLIYASAFFANGIVLSAGVKDTLLVCGACQAVCWLACIPMYVYGKRARSFIARHPRLFHGDFMVSNPSPSMSPTPLGTGLKG